MSNFQIGPYQIGSGHPPIIVAEAGINWSTLGQLPRQIEMERAIALIHAAADVGADIIKFQTHMADAEMLSDGASADYIGGSFYGLIKHCELSREEHVELMAAAKARGITFMSTAFCREAVDMLDELGVPAFKTGSGELTNTPLLRHIAAKGKPMIVSTGMATMEDIELALHAIHPTIRDVVLMNCASSYPSAYCETRLLGIQQLRQMFNCPVGQSDHSLGIATALGAVALGASIVEKHFTLDRDWPGPDQKVSILPDELHRLVIEARQIWEARRLREGMLPSEKPVAAMAHHSVVTMELIKAGECFTQENLWVKRPGTGIPAAEFYEVLGRRARRDLPANGLLGREDIVA